MPTCRLDETIAQIRERVAADRRDTCVVVNDERIVLGLLRKAELESRPELRAEDLMRPGPKTFRPDVTLEELLQSMRDHDIKTNSLVTTSDGRLVGIISRADAEATLDHESGRT